MNKDVSQILYYTDTVKITQDDFIRCLKDLGISKGDTIFIHSDIGSFGKLGTREKSYLLQSIVDALKETVGNSGTIIMPTFSYSFLKKQPYDPLNSSSSVGSLTEYFRKMPDVCRTIHPTHSVAIWGKFKSNLSDIGKNTFGEESIFQKIHKLNGKIVFLGAPFQSCTFIHYIEQMHQVPYRYLKKIKGKIKINTFEREDEFYFYHKYFPFFTDLSRFEEYLSKQNLIKDITLGRGKIQVIDSRTLFAKGMDALDSHIYFFVREDLPVLRLFNAGAYFFLKYLPWPFMTINNLIPERFF